MACISTGASSTTSGLLHLVGWTAVDVDILPLIVVAAVEPGLSCDAQRARASRARRLTNIPAPDAGAAATPGRQ